MIKRLYDAFRGVTTIRVAGERPERILNYCAANDIPFRAVVSVSALELRFELYSDDAKTLLAQNGKNGLELEEISSRGGSHFRAKAKTRAVLISALCFVLILLAASSLFVWSIDITGNERVSDEEILRSLAAHGLDYGAYRPALRTDDICDDVLTDLDSVAWMSININSSAAHIVVRERTPKPDIINEALPCDVVALFGGVITKMSVLNGEPCVKPGDEVRPGDVLISGIMRSETGNDRAVHASGSVTAETVREISAVAPLKEERKREKIGTRAHFALIIGRNRIIFYSDSGNDAHSCDKINKLKRISLSRSLTLPLGYASERETVYKTESVPIDKKAAAERMKAELISELQRRIGSGQILSREFTVAEANGLLTVTLRARCSENIAWESSYDRTNDRS